MTKDEENKRYVNALEAILGDHIDESMDDIHLKGADIHSGYAGKDTYDLIVQIGKADNKELREMIGTLWFLLGGVSQMANRSEN